MGYERSVPPAKCRRMELLTLFSRYFAIVLHIVASAVYRVRAFTSQTIADLAESLTHTSVLLSCLLGVQQADACSPPSSSDADNTNTAALAAASTVHELEEFHNNLVIVLEGLSQNVRAD